MKQYIEASVEKLREYIEKNEYKGYDPYDGLTSPLFKLPFLYSKKLIRLLFQQTVKRSPINLRPLFLIRKGFNPVTLGLCIQGYTYLLQTKHITDIEKDQIIRRIEFLIEELIKLQSKGYSGTCWGYDFDWESSMVSIPAYAPTIVATGINTNSLFEFYQLTGNEKAKEIIISSADFLLNNLNKSYNNNSFCFSYSPFDKTQVYNANMKAVRLLVQVYSITKNEEVFNIANKAIRFVLNNQNPDGSWYYSRNSGVKRIDNYHTGYVLDCLIEYYNITGDSSAKDAMDKGIKYYLSHFIYNNSIPKFYHDKIYPLDCTSAAQSIITLCKFGYNNFAQNIAEYMISNMQSPLGYFYFRKYRYITNRTSFMRWSNAWMFSALAYLNYKLSASG